MGQSEELSFDKLPKAISKLLMEVEEIKKMLIIKKTRGRPNFKKLSIDKAIDFILNQGYIMSKSKLYKLISNGQIPFARFGIRIVFSEEELIGWLESQTKKSYKSNAESVKIISNSARNKINKKY